MTAYRPTDHQQLDLWQFHEDVVFGHAQGMIIWQPRISAWFVDKDFYGEPRPERYRGMTEPEVYRDLGCSNRLYHYNACFGEKFPPGVNWKEVAHDEIHRQRILETPVGTCTEEVRKTPNNWYVIVEKHWIETPADMQVFTWLRDHGEWSWDQEAFNQVAQTWGRLGAPTMFMPRVNVQDLYINTMGVERGVYALYEWGEVVTDYFRVLHQNHLRLIDVINASPIRIINFGDNVHCATLSPALYEEYVLPAYLKRCDRLHQANKFVCTHWDGDTKALLKYAKTSGLDGIEAITPQPQGDVTLEEMKAALGDEIFLLDGIPAVFFDHTFSEAVLIECTQKVIQLFAPKLVLGISDEISSHGDIERIRLVGKIVDDYNATIFNQKANHSYQLPYKME
jgi:hypothetical protein